MPRGKRLSHNKLTTPIQNAFQYTLFLSIIYIIYKFVQSASPFSMDFFSYILPLVFTNVIIICFPILAIFFYLRDGNTVDTIKENLFNQNDSDITEINNREPLREYHSMLKEGIITQEEFDSIKKKYLKDLHQD